MNIKKIFKSYTCTIHLQMLLNKKNHIFSTLYQIVVLCPHIHDVVLCPVVFCTAMFCPGMFNMHCIVLYCASGVFFWIPLVYAEN